MKVKYIGNSLELGIVKESVYSVFAISIESKEEGWNKYYIKTEGPKYVYPFNISDFEIISSRLPEYWSFGITSTGNFYIGPRELFEINHFWEDYYNDKKECLDTVKKYLDLGITN